MLDATAIESVRAAARPLAGEAAEDEELLSLAGRVRCVLLGEASHGTHEFYRERAAITRRLIEQHGFTAVVAEADWPDAYRVNSYVRGASDDADAGAALSGFDRFPRWMWRNTDVLEFVEWLRRHNDGAELEAGFYGLDLYSLYGSIREVVDYLDRVDPPAAARARERYACFDHFGGEPQHYGLAAAYGEESCEGEVVDQLVELRRRAGELAGRNGRVPQDAHFYAEQNARLIRNAERYYRSMFRGRADSWNLRDEHMGETLMALLDHLHAPGAPAKVVVWAHNSHIGDARATEMGRRAGQLNVGQLAREALGEDAVLIGFTTHHGTVTAASDWDGPAERKVVRPALEGSFEEIFHGTGILSFVLSGDGLAARDESRLERAIGVIYRPQTERQSHYFGCDIARQFDAVIHLDATRAVVPLEPDPGWEHGQEPPETYPSGV